MRCIELLYLKKIIKLLFLSQSHISKEDPTSDEMLHVVSIRKPAKIDFENKLKKQLMKILLKFQLTLNIYFL